MPESGPLTSVLSTRNTLLSLPPSRPQINLKGGEKRGKGAHFCSLEDNAQSIRIRSSTTAYSITGTLDSVDGPNCAPAPSTGDTHTERERGLGCHWKRRRRKRRRGVGLWLGMRAAEAGQCPPVPLFPNIMAPLYCTLPSLNLSPPLFEINYGVFFWACLPWQLLWAKASPSNRDVQHYVCHACTWSSRFCMSRVPSCRRLQPLNLLIIITAVMNDISCMDTIDPCSWHIHSLELSSRCAHELSANLRSVIRQSKLDIGISR